MSHLLESLTEKFFWSYKWRFNELSSNAIEIIEIMKDDKFINSTQQVYNILFIYTILFSNFQRSISLIFNPDTGLFENQDFISLWNHSRVRYLDDEYTEKEKYVRINTKTKEKYEYSKYKLTKEVFSCLYNFDYPIWSSILSGKDFDSAFMGLERWRESVTNPIMKDSIWQLLFLDFLKNTYFLNNEITTKYRIQDTDLALPDFSKYIDIFGNDHTSRTKNEMISNKLTYDDVIVNIKKSAKYTPEEMDQIFWFIMEDIYCEIGKDLANGEI